MKSFREFALSSAIRKFRVGLIGLATASIPLVTSATCGDASFYRNVSSGDGGFLDVVVDEGYVYDDVYYYDDCAYLDDCYYDEIVIIEE